MIQSAYKSGVACITKHPTMINQISEDGTYWKVLEGAAEKEVMSQSCHCLSEVILDFTIKEVVSLMFGVEKDPATWNDSIKVYAFGK